MSFVAASSVGNEPRVLMDLRSEPLSAIGPRTMGEPVQAFNGIGRVDDLSDRWIKGEERDHFLPCPPPGRGNRGVFRSPLFLESVQLGSGLIGGQCPVNRAQINGHGLAILPGAEVQGMTHQMHDAGLDSGLREGRRDCLGKAFQAVHNGDQDVLNPAVLQLVHHRQPEFGAFVVSDPQPQNLSQAVPVDAEGHIDGVRHCHSDQWRSMAHS